MADLRIVDAPLLSTVKGTEKIPTGGEGNFSVSVNQVADFAKLKWFLATEGYVDNAVGNVQADLNLHKNNESNPHNVTKTQVGLGNVDNTADADKPVSNSTQAAIITAVTPKADKTYVDNQLALKANKSDVYTKSETYTKQESNDLVNSSISTALTPVNSSLDLAKRGIANRYDSSLTYNSGERVMLTNGDIVKSTIDGNTNDPNVIMAGWGLITVRRVRTPEQYGADGTTIGDTAAWVRMCNDLQNGEEIRASGIYKVSGSVVKISNKRGFRLDISGARFYQQDKFSRTITIEDCTKFTMKYGEFWGRGGADGEYNGASVSHNGVAGIFLNRCDHPLIVGNHLYDHAGGSIVWRETNNLMVLNNTIVGIGSTYIAAGGNGQDFAIGGFTNDKTRRDFVATISGNTISGTAFGIFANSCKSLIINGNTIDSIAGQHGVYIIECDGVSACGNTIQNCHLSAFKLQIENYAGQMGLAEPNLHLHGFSYTGNTIRNCLDGLAIISTSLSDGTDQKVFGVVVSGNTIESATQDGMVLNHCVDANIGVNTINGAARSGVNFRNSSGKLSSNTILKTGSSGVYISAYNDVELNDNTLVDVGLNNLAGSGFDHPIYSEVTSNPLPSQKSNPTISLDSNRITFTSGDAASTSLMFFADPRTKIEIAETRTNSTKPVRISGDIVYCANNDFYGFFAGSQTNPTTFIAGHGRREFHGSQNPQMALSTKAFTKGDICWNTNTTTGQYVGWVCLNSGSPGGWQGFGAVGVTQMASISNSTATDVAGVNIVLNQLLAALKSSRLMLN